MAIAFDAATTASPASGTSLTVPHTASGTQRLAVVAIAALADVVTGVTYGGQPMTTSAGLKRINGGTNGVVVYWLANPPAGAQDVVVSASGAVAPAVAVVTYTGVDQAAPITAPAASGNGFGLTATSPAVTTPAADAHLLHVSQWNDVVAISTTDTSRVNYSRAGVGQLGIADRAVPTPGSVTGQWTSAGSNDNWVTTALAITMATTEPEPEPENNGPGVLVAGAETSATWATVIGGAEVPATWTRVAGGTETPLA